MQLTSTEAPKRLPPKDTLMLAEYRALRDEILKQMDVENQLIALTIIVFGTIVGVGFQYKAAAPLILLYPALAMFFAVGWSHSDYMTRLIGTYIKERIETAIGLDGSGWEHYLSANRPSLYSWAMRGIFIMTEVLALVLGISLQPLDTTFIAILLRQPMTSFSLTANALLCIAFVSPLLTLLTLHQPIIQPIHIPIKLMTVHTERD